MLEAVRISEPPTVVELTVRPVPVVMAVAKTTALLFASILIRLVEVSMTPLTENSPTGREASANVAYNAPEACSIDVTATFAKAAAGGWVLKSVDGVTLCGPRESIGRWGSPASFAQAVK